MQRKYLTLTQEFAEPGSVAKLARRLQAKGCSLERSGGDRHST